MLDLVFLSSLRGTLHIHGRSSMSQHEIFTGDDIANIRINPQIRKAPDAAEQGGCSVHIKQKENELAP